MTGHGQDHSPCARCVVSACERGLTGHTPGAESDGFGTFELPKEATGSVWALHAQIGTVKWWDRRLRAPILNCSVPPTFAEAEASQHRERADRSSVHPYHLAKSSSIRAICVLGRA
jgi:hypothetical protein